VVDDRLLEELRRDFSGFAERCRGIVLFGSHAKGEATKRSDVDVCLVTPEKGVFDAVLSKLGGKYDIRVFEELPYHVRADIIQNHVRIYARDDLDMYFYKQLKIWKDMEHRVKENEFESVWEKLRLRRRWMSEKEKILGEIGVDRRRG